MAAVPEQLEQQQFEDALRMYNVAFNLFGASMERSRRIIRIEPRSLFNPVPIHLFLGDRVIRGTRKAVVLQWQQYIRQMDPFWSGMEVSLNFQLLKWDAETEKWVGPLIGQEIVRSSKVIHRAAWDWRITPAEFMVGMLLGMVFQDYLGAEEEDFQVADPPNS